jgi:hypothetical protein
MDIFSLDGKRIMHIDTSIKFYQKGNTGIAFKILETGEHRGLVLTDELKRSLDRDINANQDYARLYAICIESLIREDLDKFDVLVICGDEHFLTVNLCLDFLFQDTNTKKYQGKKIISIGDLRKLTGNPKLRSKADGIASIYRRKATKSLHRQQRGKILNIIELNYAKIVERWNKIHHSLEK